MDVYFDTEFLERGPRFAVSLISIGMVAADGREYYAIDEDLPETAINDHPWLMANVVPHLPGSLTGSKGSWLPDRRDPLYRSRATIALEVESFLFSSITNDEDGGGEPLELWADCGGYDRVVLGQLWGTMMNMPGFIPFWQHDLRSLMAGMQVSYEVLPEIEGDAHNALDDARHLRAQVQAARAHLVTAP